MANAIYPKFKERALQGVVDLATTAVRVILIDTSDYTYDTRHEYLSSVPVAARVATSAALGSKTFTDGTFDAANTTFHSVSGDRCEALILYVDTGTAATSRLIAYLDSGVAGLPITPNGSDIDLTWDAAGIFTL
jgi:hypothetical protein